jgi:hypothetical protein
VSLQNFLLFLFGEIMKKSIVGIVLLASFGLGNNVFGQVAGPLITPGSFPINPAVNFWNESSVVGLKFSNFDIESGSQKVKGESRATGVRFSGKFSSIGLAADVQDIHTDYDDFSTSSNNYTDYYSDSNSQEFQIASGADFVAVGLGIDNEKSESKYKDNSTSSYSDGNLLANKFGISLQFSELYFGYFSEQASSKLKTKDSSSENDYPSLKTNSNGIGIGFILKEKFDVHAEIYFLEESYAKVEDNGSYYVNDKSRATGITLEILGDTLNFGLIYQKISFEEELNKDILDDYDREVLSTVLGLTFTENLNLSYILTNDKFEQKYKDSGERFTGLDYTENKIQINFIF